MRYIAILRGINVGGHRKILMKDLIKLLESANFLNVKTYIQSGNVIFEKSTKSITELEDEISTLIREQYGFEISVIVRSKDQYQAVVEENPFQENINELHLTFLKSIPNQELQQVISTFESTPDYFELAEQHIYVHCKVKYHQTKLSNSFFEKKLKTAATTRNWKTILKIHELLEGE